MPTAKHWVNVENGNILRTMLKRILTNQNTIKEAAEFASDNITFNAQPDVGTDHGDTGSR